MFKLASEGIVALVIILKIYIRTWGGNLQNIKRIATSIEVYWLQENLQFCQS